MTDLRERRQREQLRTGRKNWGECRKEERKLMQLEKIWSGEDTILAAEKHQLRKSLEEMSLTSALLCVHTECLQGGYTASARLWYCPCADGSSEGKDEKLGLYCQSRSAMKSQPTPNPPLLVLNVSW